MAEMERRDPNEAGSSGKVAKKRKKSRGLECAAYECSSTFYTTSDGSRSECHFFKFPQKNPEKKRWCNLIKRQDGYDGFRVTCNTYLCQEHFESSEIRRNPQHWRLNKDAEPSLNLYKSFELPAKVDRKPPLQRKFISTNTKRKGAITSSSDNNLFSVSTVPPTNNNNDTTESTISIDGSSTLLSPPMSPTVFTLPECSFLEDKSLSPKYVDAETETNFSFIVQPLLLDPEPTITNIAMDHSYSCLTLTSNEHANTCLLHENILKRLQESSKQITEFKGKNKKIGRRS